MASLLWSQYTPGVHTCATRVRHRASHSRLASSSTSGAGTRGDTCSLVGTIRDASFGASVRQRGHRHSRVTPRASAGDDGDTSTTDLHEDASRDSTSRSPEDTPSASSSSSPEIGKVDYVQEFKNGVLFGETARKRFTEARIDDKGLPIADALVVTTVPVAVATLVLALGIPRPSWLVPAPWVPQWRSLPFLIPALSHGAKLSCAWIPGALAAKAYEQEAYDGTVPEAVKRTIKGGCFAIGILILATQFSLKVQFLSRGEPAPQIGDSPETDLILNGVASELIADALFEAIGLLIWRVIRCTTDIPPDEDQGQWW